MTPKEFIMCNYEDIERIIDCIKVGIFITDNEGRVLILNNESEKSGGLSKKDQLGKSIEELINQGYILESSITKVLESKKEESIIQKLGDGSQVFITGTPLMKDRTNKDEIEIIVCTERDITETMKLKKILDETKEISEQYKKELININSRFRRNKDMMVGKSFKMREVIDKALKVAKLNTTILITGESGTGKELLVKIIYKNSMRSKEPFIRINCAAIPENLMESEFFGYEKGAFTGALNEGKPGMFELANNGTLFLDEIGELSLPMQAKLLRAIQEKEIIRIGGQKVIPVDVRLIAATNKDLHLAIKRGEFRKDLFYRLNIVSIHIPPLRERKEDIKDLVLYFVELLNNEYKLNKVISDDALTILEGYEWPGNVRELRNVLERAMINYEGDTITKWQIVKQMEDPSRANEIYGGNNIGSLKKMVEDYERNIIVSLLEKYHKASLVAKILDVNKSTISKKMKKYRINPTRELPE